MNDLITQHLQKLCSQILKFSCILYLPANCYSQSAIAFEHSKNISAEIVNESIWVPASNDEAHDLKLSDTSAAVINLIFERDFDDSIKIFLDGKEVFSKKITTSKNLSVVNDEFKIPYSKDKKSVIEILLPDENKKISFNPKPGYIICYLDRINGIWSLEFSNYQRMYY